MRRPLAISFVFFVIGLCLSRYGNGSFLVVVFLVLLSAYVLGTLLKRIPLSWGILLLVLLASYGYGEVRFADSGDLAMENGVFYTVEGEVKDFPGSTEEGQRFTMEITGLNEKALDGKRQLIVLTDGTEVSYGDTVKVYGKMLKGQAPENPGSFSYAEYLEDKDLEGTLSARYDGSCLVTGTGDQSRLMLIAQSCRSRFESAISGLSGNQQGVLRGIFLGGTTGMSQGQTDVLSQSGVRHCFCVSGLHVGYLVLFAGWFLSLWKIPKNRRIFFLVPLLGVYCAMTGFQPAVIRACIMCFVVLLSVFFGRQGDSLTFLALAGYLLLLWNPKSLWLLGFQLSFGAMFGILYFTPFLKRMMRRKFPGKAALLMTFSAQIVMLPLIAYHFHMVSIVSLLINTVSCLIAGGIVLLSFAGTLLGSFFGAPLVATAGFLSSLLLGGLETAVGFPGSFFYCGEIPLWLLFLVLGLLIALPQLSFLRFRPFLSGVSVVLILLLLIFPYDRMTEQPLRVTFLSVGEKDCIYLSTPHGKDILIDAGGGLTDSTAVYTIRPFLLGEGVNTLDMIFLSHSDRDHGGSIPYLLDFFGAEQLILSEASYYYTTRLEEEAASHETEVVKVSAGDYSKIDGVEFAVLSPEEAAEGNSNDLSMVLKVTYGEFCVLFTGDAGADSLEALVKEGREVKADVLKIPHHGSKSGYSKSFYEAVSPKQVVISVGENDYGHPDKEVTSYWEAKKIPCFRTDEVGAVTFTSDGKDDQVQSFLP